MAKKDLRPKLIVIAGPNGSGKTTLTRKIFRIKNGQIYKTYRDLALHNWAQMMLEELSPPRGLNILN